MKRQILAGLVVAASILMMTACSANGGQEQPAARVDATQFETTIDSIPCHLYTLKGGGIEMTVTNFGARIVELLVPDRDGMPRDIVLGFDNVEQYRTISNDFGATIGRYANRINQGRITVEGNEIQLPTNNYGHTLHGGPQGWQYKMFTAEQQDDATLVLTINSPDGDENFPGNVVAEVTYRLTDEGALDIAYRATTDAQTIINLTNHSYFNLSGDASQTILDNILYINADAFTPVDSTFMTTGELRAVEGTPFDFRTPHAIGEQIDEADEQLGNGKGYDHNFVLNTQCDETVLAASVTSPLSGITLELYTDQPGVQIYTGNFLDGTVVGKQGIAYPQRSAIALETQVYPDSPNKVVQGLGWPNPFYGPDDVYTQHTIYKFSQKE